MDKKFKDLFVEGMKAIEWHGASSPLARLLQRNIDELLKVGLDKDKYEESPPPQAVFMQDWTEPPYFGGWHAWCVGYEPWRIRKDIVRPFAMSIFTSAVFSADQEMDRGCLADGRAVAPGNARLQIEKSALVEWCVAQRDELGGRKGHESVKEYLDW